MKRRDKIIENFNNEFKVVHSSELNGEVPKNFRPFKIVYDFSFFDESYDLTNKPAEMLPKEEEQYNAEKMRVQQVLMDILQQCDQILKRYVFINQNVVPYQSIDEHLNCSVTSKLLMMKLDQNDFNKLTTKDYVADLVIFVGVINEEV